MNQCLRITTHLNHCKSCNTDNCMLLRLVSVLVLLLVSFGASADVPRIAASSSLQFALNEVVKSYSEQADRAAPQIVYGSSGNLYRQIVQGAPFELFFSARSELTGQLFEQGVSKDAGELFGTGKLVLLSAKPFKVNGSLAEFSLAEFFRAEVLSGGQKLAIANPAHAPYGRAAQQVLQSLQLWQQVQPHLVNGEQVSQATRFVTSGASSFGLVSLSLALSPAIVDKSHYQLIDSTLHAPVEHTMVRLNTSTDAAEHFYQFVLSNEMAGSIFKRYGLRAD